MARALSQVYSQIRGSVGGVTYLANQHHQIVVRARTSPVDPSSTAQNQVRQAFSGAAVDWRQLTDQERSDWDDYADGLTYPNPLGPQTLSGRLVAMSNLSFARYIIARGFELTSGEKTAPTTPGFLALDPLGIQAPGQAGTGFQITCGNPSEDPIKVMLWTSRIFHPTRNSFKGPFRSGSILEMDIAAETTGVQDIEIGSDDDIVFVYGRAITDDGPKSVSEPFILRAVVQTTAV